MKTSSRLSLALAVLAISVVEARADRYVASSTDFGSVGTPDSLYIYRIDASSITEVHHEVVTSKPELAWSDPRTLWVLTESTASPYAGKLQKFVDGSELESFPLAPADWSGSTVITKVRLRVTNGGEVWIETCVDGKPSPRMGVAPVCKKIGFLRVDTKPFKLASKRPTFRDSRLTPTTGRQALGDHVVATFQGRSLYDMHNDPKPYDGQWKLVRDKQPLGELPGQQLLVAPR